MPAACETILVTGATGFIGSALVGALLGRGYAVRALGRDVRRGQELSAMGADFRPVDLGDRPAMLAAARGVHAVVHVGALALPWGAPGQFEAVNVQGTRHVVEACQAQDVRRLVYVSSPSVTSVFDHQFGLKESHPVPAEFVSHYSRTKWLGEQVVQAARQGGLETVIVRPKAVYGPGDTTIFPRLVRAAQMGRLRVIGNGQTLTNVTYIDDVVEGLCLALTSHKAEGGTYVLTGGEDVAIWEMIAGVLQRLGLSLGNGSITTTRALALAQALETAWRVGRLAGEPPLTRYTVGTVAFSQTYDIAAAKRDLGYAPRVGVEEGVERFARHYRAFGDARAPIQPSPKPPVPAKPTAPGMRCEWMSTGSCLVPGTAIFQGASPAPMPLPVLIALLHHPVHGPILFDTGFSRRFFEATRHLPARLFRWATPTDVDEGWEARALVAERGVAPEDVRLILLSHMDPDHYGGLRDFPNARIALTAEAFEAARGLEGFAALKARILPGHIPEDFAARAQILPPFDGPPLGPFASSCDLFGDGTLQLVTLPGHSPGQFGALVRREDGTQVFLVADACWTRRWLGESQPRTQVHRLLAADRMAQQATYEQLREFQTEFPHIPIVPSHCPDAAAELGLVYLRPKVSHT